MSLQSTVNLPPPPRPGPPPPRRQVAPYDVLVADERLPAEEVAAQRAALEMWKLEHCYPMLPRSCIIMESVPEGVRPPMPPHRKGRTY